MSRSVPSSVSSSSSSSVDEGGDPRAVSGETYHWMGLRDYAYWCLVVRWSRPRKVWCPRAGGFVVPERSAWPEYSRASVESEAAVGELLTGHVLGRAVDTGKVFCERCSFFVKPEGHEERCRVGSDPGVSLERFGRSQLGDALHRFDVRLYLLSTGVPKKEVGFRTDQLICGKAQAAWYSAYDGAKYPATGSSVDSLSTAFEASYSGEFRAAYRSSVIPVASMVIPDYARPFLDW